MSASRKRRNRALQGPTTHGVALRLVAHATEPADVPSAPQSLGILQDMALKRYDQQDKALDAMTAKATMVFGSSTLLWGLVVALLEKLHGDLWGQGALTAGMLLLYATMSALCWRVYRVANLDGLPDIGKMLEANEHLRPDPVVRKVLLDEVTLASDELAKAIDARASDVDHAIKLLFAQVLVVLMGFVLTAIFHLPILEVPT